MNVIRMLITDDHPSIRDGLRIAVQAVPHIQVVGEASNAKEAIQQVGDLKPDIILMDIVMPGMDGIEATRVIRSKYPQTRILILSAFEDLALLSTSIAAGADGYLLKGSPSREIVIAVEAVSLGMFVVDKALTNIVKKVVANRVLDTDDPPREIFSQFSDTLYTTFILHLKGMTNAEIAEQRVLSKKAIQNHITDIYKLINLNPILGDCVDDLDALRKEVEARSKRKNLGRI